MKKLTTLLLILALIASLVACGGKAEEKNVDLAALDKEIQSADLFTVQLEPANESIMEKIVKLDLGLAQSYVYYICGEYTGEEYGLFAANSEEDANKLESALNARIEELKATYADYAPDALPRIDGARVARAGNYVGIIIAEKAAEASALFDKYFA